MAFTTGDLERYRNMLGRQPNGDELNSLKQYFDTSSYDQANKNRIVDIFTQFRNVLGRDPNQSEIDYYNKFLETSNGLDPYELGQALQATPEFQTKQTETLGKQYEQQLANADVNTLNQAANQINSNFSALGRGNSSALTAQLAQVSQGLANQRQSALADFYRGGAANTVNMSQNRGMGAIERAYGLRDEARQRGYQIDDLNRYQDIYNDYLNRQAKTQRRQAIAQGVGTLFGTAVGAGAGAAMGNPAAGAQMGSQYGSMLGNFGANLQR